MFKREHALRVIGLLLLTSLICSCTVFSNYRKVPVEDANSTTTSRNYDNMQKASYRPKTYTVKKGDTLYVISWRYDISVSDLQKWNKISSPDSIDIGQKISLYPPQYKKQKTVARKPAYTAPPKVTTRGRAVSTPIVASSKLPGFSKWKWPIKGSLYKRFSSSSKGIQIRGRVGQSVYASAPGVVVYANYMKTYGNMIIVKHKGDSFTIYGNNQKLLVKTGQLVKAGQKIATLGKNSHNVAALYFELRRRGVLVNPTKYLT